MINRERGPRDQEVYEPTEEIRVFDGAEDEEDEEGSRLPLLIVLALVVLAMFAGVVYLAYTQGVSKGRGEMPVLAAASGPARVAPGQPGGTKVPYQGFKIYQQPAPPDGQVKNAEGNTTARTAAQDAAGAAQTAPAKPSPAEPAARPHPAPAPAPAKAVSAPTPQATAAPRSLTAPVKPVAPAKPAAQPAAAAGSGAYFLQVGAFKSQADAEAAWKTYKARHATLLAGHDLDVQRVDLGPKGIWYRARVGGFPSRDVALALCDRLKADGGACFLAH